MYFKLNFIVIASIIVILLIFLIIYSKIRMNAIARELERILHKFVGLNKDIGKNRGNRW